eukprot:scaffold4272_cov370-Prasinococcus_capsulatus_cf.AAC.1
MAHPRPNLDVGVGASRPAVRGHASTLGRGPALGRPILSEPHTAGRGREALCGVPAARARAHLHAFPPGARSRAPATRPPIALSPMPRPSAGPASRRAAGALRGAAQ